MFFLLNFVTVHWTNAGEEAIYYHLLYAQTAQTVYS